MVNPKRVLHIVSAMNRGGTETLLMNVYRNTDRSKIQFDFVSHRKEKCDYDDEIESLGGKIYRIASLGQRGPLSYVLELRKIIQTYPYIAVHSHTDYQCGFPALAAKWSGVKRRICHSHSNQWTKENGFKEKVALKALRAVIKYSATDCCACSVEAGRFLFGHKRQVRILKNGIDVSDYIGEAELDRLCVRDELRIHQGAKIIGHVGSISYIKNQVYILKVLKQLLEEGLDFYVVLVGDGPLREFIEKKAKKLEVFDHVRILGVRADIPRLMKAFDVFLFPSLFEGFGIAALEAQCAGTPCVVSDTVPKSTDMGLGLISYVSLDEDLRIWSEEVKKALLRSRPDAGTVSRHFFASGFNIRENVPNWLALYGVS